MNSVFVDKLRMLGEFSLITAFAGIIYQLVDVKYVDHLGVIMGASLGFGFGIIELFILSGLKKKFQKLSLLQLIFLKAISYLIIIVFFSNLIGLIAGLLKGKEMEEFYAAFFDRDQFVLIIYTLTIFVLLSFYIQINLLLGRRVLLKFLLGKYRKPVNEHRIFMFLDLKSSTTLAERLGLENYYALLNDFFHEISEPVRTSGAEIYQYVGDEVVFTWKTDDGLTNTNCLKIFYKIRENVYRNRKYYRDKYGEIPDFKAGLHFGEVISAQIGDIKREIIYNGDVLNTSARIQEQCNVFKRELLISGVLLNQLNIENEYNAEKMDTIKLRGKENEIELYSLSEF
jgi:adenylate cyclase